MAHCDNYFVAIPQVIAGSDNCGSIICEKPKEQESKIILFDYEIYLLNIRRITSFRKVFKGS